MEPTNEKESMADFPFVNDPFVKDEASGEETASQPSESPTEKEAPADAPSTEGATEPEKAPNTPSEEELPYHKNPRWQKVFRENKEMKERLAALEASASTPPPRAEEPKDASIPAWFGGDEATYRLYKADQEAERSRIKQELIQEQQRAQEASQQEQVKLQQWVSESIAQVEEANGLDFSRDESLKNEIMQMTIKYSPVDDNGNLDFQKGYELLQLSRGSGQEVAEAEKKKAKKSLASTTVGGAKAEAEPREYMTPADFRNKGWRDIIK